jgi:hypothetical protein
MTGLNNYFVTVDVNNLPLCDILMRDYVPSPEDFCPQCKMATIYIVASERHCLIGCSVTSLEVAC